MTEFPESNFWVPISSLSLEWLEIWVRFRVRDYPGLNSRKILNSSESPYWNECESPFFPNRRLWNIAPILKNHTRKFRYSSLIPSLPVWDHPCWNFEMEWSGNLSLMTRWSESETRDLGNSGPWIMFPMTTSVCPWRQTLIFFENTVKMCIRLKKFREL